MNQRSPFLVIVILLSSLSVFGQNKEVPVEIVIDKLSHKNVRGFLEKTTNSVFKFFNSDASPDNLLTSRCIVVKSTEKEKTVGMTEDPTLSPMKNLKAFKIGAKSDVIRLVMETFKNDNGDVCEFDKGDNYHSVVSSELKLSEIAPGVFSQVLGMSAKDDKFSATFKIRYGIPSPADIKSDLTEKVSDVGKSVQLSTSIELVNKSGLSYIWEYKTDDDNDWKEFAKTTGESVGVNPAKDIFKKGIKTSQVIRFRVKAISAELAGSYSVPYEIKVTPAGPQFEAAGVAVTETCPNTASGMISVKNITSPADNIAYYVIKGKEITEDDQPDIIAEGKKLLSGKAAISKGVEISKLAEGDYTLVVYNADMPVGKNFKTHVFTVGKFAQLGIKAESVTEATCATMPDGQILIEMTGGAPGKLISSLAPSVGKLKLFGKNIVYSELPPGMYTVFIKDACNQSVSTKELEIQKKMVQLSGKIEIINEPLNNFPNGSVKVAIEGGSGQFKYTLTRTGTNNAVPKEKTTSTPAWEIDNMVKGSYKLKIIDITYPLCPGWDTTVILNGKTLVSADTTATEPVKKDSLKKDSTVAYLPVRNQQKREAKQFTWLVAEAINPEEMESENRLFTAVQNSLFCRLAEMLGHTYLLSKYLLRAQVLSQSDQKHC